MARVTRIGDIVDPATRTVKVRFLVSNPDVHLKPEMFASVILFLDESERGLTVPAKAVFTERSRNFVYVRIADREFARRQVEVLADGSGRLRISSGLKQGEKVVSDGVLLLRPGYLRYADLPGYLGGALVAAYPSYGEGFGLPILEAMACGAPVLTTPRLSVPEVGGDAVAYTGEDPERIAADLAALLADPSRRALMAQAGCQRAKEFTWDSSADVHMAAWSRAALS